MAAAFAQHMPDFVNWALTCPEKILRQNIRAELYNRASKAGEAETKDSVLYRFCTENLYFSTRDDHRRLRDHDIWARMKEWDREQGESLSRSLKNLVDMRKKLLIYLNSNFNPPHKVYVKRISVKTEDSENQTTKIKYIPNPRRSADETVDAFNPKKPFCFINMMLVDKRATHLDKPAPSDAVVLKYEAQGEKAEILPLDKADRSFATSVDKLRLSRSLSTGKQTKFAKPVNKRSLSTDVAKLRSASETEISEPESDSELESETLFNLESVNKIKEYDPQKLLTDDHMESKEN
jgi:hypothetical protein